MLYCRPGEVPTRLSADQNPRTRPPTVLIGLRLPVGAGGVPNRKFGCAQPPRSSAGSAAICAA
ncbi:hypothetical protein I545_5615 [Mycobacterium kansasii 662]|uniref:Uncharacterized protein n=2 Tax=Mycobacterium kansasii TaxID=1768 RepID=A0A1V3WIF1_MYCKA|nr:hypothetical protein I545_5615 [Mycobacterium kansasii 662]OOK66548.1 hypothetical protein BZL30_8328 [Mycobacterium kansasii]